MDAHALFSAMRTVVHWTTAELYEITRAPSSVQCSLLFSRAYTSTLLRRAPMFLTVRVYYIVRHIWNRGSSATAQGCLARHGTKNVKLAAKWLLVCSSYSPPVTHHVQGAVDNISFLSSCRRMQAHIYLSMLPCSCIPTVECHVRGDQTPS